MTAIVLVRREAPTDIDAIRGVHNAAFGQDPDKLTWEARLVDDLRSSGNWIPALSFVAEIDGIIVGHVLATRGHLVPSRPGPPTRALGLAPVGVLPDHQHLRIGTDLMRAIIGAADALDEQIICLLGSPEYYQRFGFVLASTLQIAPPDPGWTPHFQALPLSAIASPAPTGTFQYGEAFDRGPVGDEDDVPG